MLEIARRQLAAQPALTVNLFSPFVAKAAPQLLWLVLMLTTAALIAPAEAKNGLSKAKTNTLRQELFEGINRARSLASLNRLKRHKRLENSAQNHANYLARHGDQPIGHKQQDNLSLFSGTWPEDRAVTAGYDSKKVWEIVSIHDESTSWEAFVTSVYHRMQVLNLEIDEMGIGVSRRGDKLIQVVNFGQSRWRTLCRNHRSVRNPDAKNVVLGLCAQDTQAVLIGQVQSLEENVLRTQPKVVVWPPDEYASASTQLSNELPNPLPGKQLLGNAITLQFNTSHDLPSVQAWQLLEQRNGSLGTVAAEMITKDTDPHNLLATGQYALVPIAPLKYATKYRTRVKYRTTKGLYDLEWNFTSHPLPWPELVLDSDETIWMAADEPHLLRLRGNSLQPEFDQLSVLSSDGVKVDFERPVPDILLMRLSGPPCARARIRYRSQPRIRLQIKPPEQTSDPDEGCRQMLEDSLPGLKVYGNGDALEMQSNQEYKVSLVPESYRDSIGKLRWAAPQSCSIQAKPESRLTLSIRIRCSKGKRVRFSLSKERFFQVTVR